MWQYVYNSQKFGIGKRKGGFWILQLHKSTKMKKKTLKFSQNW